MNQIVEAQIVDAEDRLRTAMLRSDASALDELLAPELIFTNHLGQLLGKEDDLAAYRSGKLKVKHLKSSEQHVRLSGDVAIVSVRVQLSGTYDGNPANGDFRFTRVWALSPHKAWHVVAAHAGRVA
jgi:ketosteroid isomerase-like protein